MRILLADDQPQVRSALKLLLEQQANLTVVAEASEAEGILRQAGEARPDVMLLDWELPGLHKGEPAGRSAAELLAGLRGLCPDMLIIVLSGRPEAEAVALDSGADAFVSKGDPPEFLLTALRSAVAASSS